MRVPLHNNNLSFGRTVAVMFMSLPTIFSIRSTSSAFTLSTHRCYRSIATTKSFSDVSLSTGNRAIRLMLCPTATSISFGLHQYRGMGTSADNHLPSLMQLHAADHHGGNKRNPFGKSSGFSVGTKTDPSEYRNIEECTAISKAINGEQTKKIHPSHSRSMHGNADDESPDSNHKTPSQNGSHPELEKQLLLFRTQQSASLKKAAYGIFSDASLGGICESLPTTKETLLQVKGIGPKKVEMFGTRILTIVRAYKDQLKDKISVEASVSSLTSEGVKDNASLLPTKKISKTQLKEDLRQYRIQQAEAVSKPAYTIFPNAALEGIYASLPTNEHELLDVKGIGPKKAEMFGDDILAIVSKYVDSPALNKNRDTNGHGSMSNIPARPTKIDSETLTSEQKLAADIALGTDRRNLFITGSAGTGKSHVLKYLVQELKEQNEDGESRKVGICAPTGVAAIIVGGSTLHSFFGIGLGTGSLSSLLGKVNKNSAAKRRIDETDVLIIDECSMVSSDLLEKLDEVTRAIRRNGNLRDQPFGGMQIIAFGDFFQLPPVDKNNNDRYQRPFCFDSHVWSELGLSDDIVELKQVQRQENEEFISMLNKVRVGLINEEDIRHLNSKCLISDTRPLPTDGIVPTRLYVLNKDVDMENITRLEELSGEEIICRAIDRWREPMPSGTAVAIKKQMKDSLDMELPTEVRLKVGAQVMLTRNKDLENNLVNGSRGVVERFIDDGGDIPIPLVRFDDGMVTKIPPVESVRYNRDGGEGCLVRMQIPLKLAWAITIHKSQGSTLTRAMLDITSAFEYGQCYVALSRVKSLDGLWLEKPARLSNILVSPQVVDFFRTIK